MILLLRISLLACVVTGLTPPPCSLRPSTRVASSSTDIVAKAMGPNADRAIQLLRDAADDLGPRGGDLGRISARGGFAAP